MNKKNEWAIEGKNIDYVADVAMGFFTIPFLYFIVHTTIKIVKNPLSISEGGEFLYIALLTGIYYILVKNVRISIGSKKENIMFMLFGLAVLIISFMYIM